MEGTTLLRRMGRKTKLLPTLLNFFPKHDIYMEPFFGSGAVLFGKKVHAKYNFVNDFDDNVYNLFMQVMFNRQELYDMIENTPYHKTVFNWLKSGQKPDGMSEELYKAYKFVIISNYTYLGAGATMSFKSEDSKAILLRDIHYSFDFLNKRNIKFTNSDFRDFFKQYSFRDEEKSKVFIYCDPPYLNTDNNYADDCQFTAKDTEDLFNVLIGTECKFAISEFNSEPIMELAKKYNLKVYEIGERINIKNRRVEVLITNYLPPAGLFLR